MQADRLRRIHKSEAQTFLTLMMNVNTLSFNTRYSVNKPAPEYIFEKQEIGFDEEESHRSVIQMITNIACFKYQSCEFDGYDETLVFNVLQKLQDELLQHFKDWCVQSGYDSREEIKIKPYHKLPFSDECSWGLND